MIKTVAQGQQRTSVSHICSEVPQKSPLGIPIMMLYIYIYIRDPKKIYIYIYIFMKGLQMSKRLDFEYLN